MMPEEAGEKGKAWVMKLGNFGASVSRRVDLVSTKERRPVEGKRWRMAVISFFFERMPLILQ